MNLEVLNKLKQWRDETARKEGVEIFRVISNSSIEEIARIMPRNKEELTSIKGIKDKKYYKYGKEIFTILKSASEIGNSKSIKVQIRQTFNPAGDETSLFVKNGQSDTETIFSVSGYIDYLNKTMQSSGRVKIRGEVTSVDKREKVTYFNIKDTRDGGLLGCLIFNFNYSLSGITLEVGMEIVVTAIPDIYKPTGKLSMKTSLIELFGEGPLKKEYERLKAKLEKEGFFLKERKKILPKLPRIVCLITSNQGAAIGDFITNIGRYGFKIKFINSSVEGKNAIFDLLGAIRTAKQITDVDTVAIIRGGGSLESLQAFNNESIVREIGSFGIPVVCGIGHERDISLASLVADVAVSTPTAAAVAIRESWDEAARKIDMSEKYLIGAYENALIDFNKRFDSASYSITGFFDKMSKMFHEALFDVKICFERLISRKEKMYGDFREKNSHVINEYEKAMTTSKQKLKLLEMSILSFDPEKQLRLGYSIVYSENRIVKSAKNIELCSDINIRMYDGEIKAQVKAKNINKL